MLRLIDAEELKHILNNSKYYGTKAGNAFADMITECKAIEGREKGKWLPYLEEHHDMFKCSNCGQITRVSFKCFSPPYYYCPYCGADMREEKTNG